MNARMRTRSGKIVWMLDEAVLEADENGVPVWHGVLYEVSERKNAEAELQRALSQQAVVAKLGERALGDGDPEALPPVGALRTTYCCIRSLETRLPVVPARRRRRRPRRGRPSPRSASGSTCCGAGL